MENDINRKKVQKEMESIKDILTFTPCLEIPDQANHECLVRTDASDLGIGVTLRQMQPGSASESYEEGVLAYFHANYMGQKLAIPHTTAFSNTRCTEALAILPPRTAHESYDRTCVTGGARPS